MPHISPPIIAAIIAGIIAIFIFVQNRRTARITAGAELIKKIDAAKWNYSQSVKKTPYIILEDIANFKSNLYWWQARRFNELWNDFKLYEHDYTKKRTDLLIKLREFVISYS